MADRSLSRDLEHRAAAELAVRATASHGRAVENAGLVPDQPRHRVLAIAPAGEGVGHCLAALCNFKYCTAAVTVAPGPSPAVSRSIGIAGLFPDQPRQRVRTVVPAGESLEHTLRAIGLNLEYRATLPAASIVASVRSRSIKIARIICNQAPNRSRPVISALA